MKNANNSNNTLLALILAIVALITLVAVLFYMGTEFIKTITTELSTSTEETSAWQAQTLSAEEKVPTAHERPDERVQRPPALSASAFCANPKELRINSMSELSYKTREYVFKMRERHVARSLFPQSNYSAANGTMLAGIQDNKPWISIHAVYTPSRVDGPSEESRFINNPNLLVAIIAGNGYFSSPRTDEQRRDNPRMHFEEDKFHTFFIPTKMSYCERPLTIIAEYPMTRFLEKYIGFWRGSRKEEMLGKQTFLLTGLNARDLGFPYGYAEKVSNISFIESSSNISNSVAQFQDFIHTGGACQVEGGCNNASPYQPMLVFRLDDYPYNQITGAAKNTYMKFKLWKNYPNSKTDKADVNFVIVLK
jgi:hypothetical protein